MREPTIEELKQVRTPRQLKSWLRRSLTASLQGPKREETLAFLGRLKAEHAADPSIYRIQLLGFPSDRIRKLVANVLLVIGLTLDRPHIEIRDRDRLGFEIAFLSKEAVRAFADAMPVFGDEARAHFCVNELRRHPRTGHWVRSGRPIFWGPKRART